MSTTSAARLLPENLSDCLALLENRHPTTIDLGLDRCGEVWSRMGASRPARKVFVVAGTNGKGSTVATICALLGSLDYSYGSYTSPHLLEYNERVRVNGVSASDEDLLQAFETVERARGETSLTYFEFGTLAAFELLSKHTLEFAVMEVGLGGRLDAVNLLDADCAVITPIDLDHQAYLGDDLESIGREKAGIIRPGKPVICTQRHPPASVINRAQELAAPLKRPGRDFDIETHGDKAHLTLGERKLALPLPRLAGPFQLDNLATSVVALLELVPSAGNHPEALARGLQAVSLAGRFERISQCPAIWVDVGHNPMAAQALSKALAAVKQLEGMSGFRCVLGMLADKDAASVAQALQPEVVAWYCAGLEGERGQGGTVLAQRIQKACEISTVMAYENVALALESAVADLCPDEGVLVFGSFLTAAQALRYWRSPNRGN